MTAAQSDINILTYRELEQPGPIAPASRNQSRQEYGRYFQSNMSDEFLSALEQILEEGNVPQETINRIAIAMALDAANQLSAYKTQNQIDLTELKLLLEAQTDNIDKLSKTVAKHDKYLAEHPPFYS